MRGTRHVYYVKKESRLRKSSTKILEKHLDPIHFFSFFCCFDFLMTSWDEFWRAGSKELA